MKKYIVALFLSLAYCVGAQTWTLHGCKDNNTSLELQVGFAAYGHAEIWYETTWEWNHDLLNPDDIHSGFYRIFWNGGNLLAEPPSGYSDTLSFDVTILDGQQLDVISLWTDNQFLYWYPCEGDWGPFMSGAGEYWIDYNADGSARVSTALLSDFGKWAWDGSINPSWVEPLAGKHLAKGHKK